jgi:hypothetical protein
MQNLTPLGWYCLDTIEGTGDLSGNRGSGVRVIAEVGRRQDCVKVIASVMNAPERGF